MATIEWTEKFLSILNRYIDEARTEYGRATALRWAEEIATMEERLRIYPLSYSPERLLLGRAITYRRCHVMNRRFKIIYYYDEKEDVVHLIDIWDTRRNPKMLVRRVK